MPPRRVSVMKDTNVLKSHGRTGTIHRNAAAATGAQATEQPSRRDQKHCHGAAGGRPGASSTHLNDLRLRVLRPERLGWGGHTHCYKAIWFSI